MVHVICGIFVLTDLFIDFELVFVSRSVYRVLFFFFFFFKNLKKKDLKKKKKKKKKGNLGMWCVFFEMKENQTQK